MDIIRTILVFIPGFLLGIVGHEVAHGWVANRLGDPTAKMLGRLSLNPMKHIDLWGTVLLPLSLLLFSKGQIMFGYAKPVPISGINFNHNRWGHLLVALAGPVANILIAILIILLAWLGQLSGLLGNYGMREVLRAALQINVMLAAFNLLPIPPLDGSEMVTTLLPGPWAYRFQQLAPFSFLILMLLYITGFLSFIMSPIYLLIQLILTPFGNPFGAA